VPSPPCRDWPANADIWDCDCARKRDASAKRRQQAGGHTSGEVWRGESKPTLRKHCGESRPLAERQLRIEFSVVLVFEDCRCGSGSQSESTLEAAAAVSGLFVPETACSVAPRGYRGDEGGNRDW
jgi:hypothetical protein